jgi:hypothetical protein
MIQKFSNHSSGKFKNNLITILNNKLSVGFTSELVLLPFFFKGSLWLDETDPLGALVIMVEDRYGAIGGMIGKENRSTESKPAPVPLCPIQIPHDLNRAPIQVSAVEGRQLTT